MDILKVIKSRRSIRKFKKKVVSRKVIDKILEAGRWAPSGLNNQPWRFMVLGNKRKDNLAKFTHYGQIIKAADKIILVFLDKKSSYSYQKDLMAVGACIQNMLLYAHSIKLGACWLGEILNQRRQLERCLKIPTHLELEAVLAIGVSAKNSKPAKRKTLKTLLIK